MGVQREIWVDYIVGKLFKNNEFMTKSFDESAFVLGGKVVHIPQVGASKSIVKNRTILPATPSRRTDTEVTYPLDWYTKDPFAIPNAEEIELSFSKMDSAMREEMNSLVDYVGDDLIVKWMGGAVAAGNIVLTTGADTAFTETGQTGTRKVPLVKDIKSLSAKMNKKNVPKNDRFIMLESNMLDQLMDDLTVTQERDFSQSLDAKNGVIGKLFGFNVMERSSVAVLNAANDTVDAVGAAVAADDNLACLAWQRDEVCVAKGEVNFFDKRQDPEWYGDVFSYDVRMGGRCRRTAADGVYALVQG